jgi:polyisoprenoid-binding protein YceI
MRRVALTAIFVLALAGSIFGQGKYLTNEGNIIFFSHTTLEDITAENNEVASVIDADNGEVAIIVLMTAFEFEKKKMQEHFNENYVESEKFPKATFRGAIVNNGDVDYSTRAVYEVDIEGEMTIHGISKQITAKGSIEVLADGILAKTKFLLNPEDYGIKIPKVVRKNIAENMEIRIDLNHKPI